MGQLDDSFLLDDENENIQNQEELENDNSFEEEDGFEEDNNDKNDEEQSEEESANQSFTENDSLNLFLQQKGIDPHAVIYENEDGEEEEVNFYDLDFEEQMNILNYKQDDYDLDDEEVNVINFLRENEIDLEQYTQFIKQKAIEEYQSQNQSYSVDEYSDDDVYTAYLKNQYDNLSNEDIEAEIEKEKSNPELFAKKVEKLREYYKEQEQELNQQTEEEKKAKEEEENNEIKDVLTKAAVSTNNFMGFELEDDDRREALKFIFEKDATGKSKFYKMFDDPEKLFRIALFALKENEIHDIIDKELSKLSKPQIKKVDIKPKEKLSKVVVNSKFSKSSSGSKYVIEDDILKDLL
ncbi:MAG: hypothetical protein RR578_01470 [Bacilli bacterium]